MKQRHKKQVEEGRCCWICGKLGGEGFTSALRALGYDVPLKGVVAHAHGRCVQREQRNKGGKQSR
jgi:hypothetical protein